MTRMNHLHLPNTDLEVRFHSRNSAIPQSVRDYARDRLLRCSRYGIVIDSVDVQFQHERNPRQANHAYRVEVTGRATGLVVRAEAAGPDWLTALDDCLGKWHERLRRTSERRAAKRRGRFGHANGAPGAVGPIPNVALSTGVSTEEQTREIDDTEELLRHVGPLIVKEKTHAAMPMTVAEAIDAMELVGHEFYAFIDSESGQFSVVYQRRAFTYGLIRLVRDGEMARI